MMIYRCEQDENGPYRDETGKRFSLYACRRHADAKGVNVGWTAFESAEACLAAWGLSPLPPEAVSMTSEDC